MGELVKNNIGLIGFMGTGKTAIGKVLAKKTDREFFDTDLMIEKQTGNSISEIFRDNGEEFFRHLESDVVKEVCQNESAVISFGGGAILDSKNREMIKQTTFVVLLRSSAKTIYSRTLSNNSRPLLANSKEPLLERIELLLARRNQIYIDTMDFEIDTDKMSIYGSVKEIMWRLEL